MENTSKNHHNNYNNRFSHNRKDNLKIFKRYVKTRGPQDNTWLFACNKLDLTSVLRTRGLNRCEYDSKTDTVNFYFENRDKDLQYISTKDIRKFPCSNIERIISDEFNGFKMTLTGNFFKM